MAAYDVASGICQALRLGENYRAFDFLGNSLTHDPKNPKTILAAGSIIQDHSDMDVVGTRGFHSSTSQLNLSRRFYH